MQRHLVIVESPAKAKTIGKFLGPNYSVLSSYGHVRDLSPKNFSIDIERDYAPQYEIPEDKKTLIKELNKAADLADVVWLASDEDREGEAIAWHLSEVLKLKDKPTHRIVFHEITKPAIEHAILNPRSIDKHLVDAQQARRVLDRIVGFELSPVLWKRIKPSLSAGRVQSVAVRIVVEREREIQAFEAQTQYRTMAMFMLPDGKTLLEAELDKRFSTEQEAQSFLQSCVDAEFHISEVIKKPGKRSPAAPFTTSTLQQEAARKLGFSVAQTMRIAQKLYEAGFITYMRTDSTNLSDLAMNDIAKLVREQWGEDFHQARRYQTKSKGAQEAHEAIRPTYADRETIAGTVTEKKLYDLIRKRCIASQMADMKTERTTVTIASSSSYSSDAHFIAQGEVVLFEGFYSVYKEGTDEENKDKPEGKLLPPVLQGDVLKMEALESVQRFSQRPARYTEASLVRKLEELGIGRPSTYAPTIQTIQNREYVIKGDKEGESRDYCRLHLDHSGQIVREVLSENYGQDRGKLMPTDIGIVVNDFLTARFPNIVDLNFTAKVEDQFDHIAEGKLEWSKVIDSFYKRFHPVVEEASVYKQDEERVGERILGVDPKTGKQISVRIGRYGPMLQMGMTDRETDEKPRFASLPPNCSMQTITLEEAIAVFDLPKTLGQYEGKNVVVSVGRFGPYVSHAGKYTSIPKGIDPLQVSLDDAIVLIEEKRQAEAKSLLKTFDDDELLQIRNGRFGPYIKYGTSNYKLPKDADVENLSREDCLKIIAEAPEKKTSRKKDKKVSATKNVSAGVKSAKKKA
ncbi:DNA topoisomerase I [Porphyromonas crevioricanis JCM 15906]|uniref:DNA topoisomerase 1 n=1 Tax=Porphyromonas crevioricanis JCM 15906 TaxID=1305617 RepID=T1CNP6_9PORP|nr:type I DNA topoisomerase [Porphyromonas crevioricanis]GAD05467.1 DNA topoisomerase I [Porphyromonas crevioricanis JCM 15906]SJZ94644.1 DNA topoisomerase-1 [Porphyromonas crevioricanis]